MTGFALKVRNLGKEYILGGAEQHHESFRELLASSVLAPFRKLRRLSGIAKSDDKFWALDNINFDVQQGEIVGIIGRNGAGKSTLLKVLSRITSPTTGKVLIKGRVASLLEVGTGFHPELTGRENIFLNGAILGMSHDEIERRFDEIVSFAEIEQFLDTPVKRYSSGMYVRLAFAVAAHVDVDILVVDEVLAVGDQQFQQKCINRMGDVSNRGKTVLFVSHNMGTISSLCSRGILLSGGRVTFDGSITEAINKYMETPLVSAEGLSSISLIGPLKDEMEFQDITLNGWNISELGGIEPGENLNFEVKALSKVSLKGFSLQLSILKDGVQIVTVQDVAQPSVLRKGEFHSRFRIPANLLRPGNYCFGVGGVCQGAGRWMWGADVGKFTIVEKWSDQCKENNYGLVNCDYFGERVQP